MPSFIWNREPEEAYQNPYEYEAQDQFVREANNMLNAVYELLMDDRFFYKRNDTSVEKALYMLHVDSIESLKECLVLLSEKRHSVAGRLLRDVFENVSLCNYFYFDTSNDKTKNLRKWFKNEVISNSICRKSVEDRLGKTEHDYRKIRYSHLSKITHRTYCTLAYSYVLGAGETMRYEGRAEGRFLVLPHTISMYYAVLSEMILFALDEIGSNRLIDESVLRKIIEESYEEIPIERRFGLFT